MNTFLFLISFFASFFSLLHGMDTRPKKTLSESTFQQKWQTLQHPGNQLVAPTNIKKKIAQHMVQHISFHSKYTLQDIIPVLKDERVGISSIGTRLVYFAPAPLLFSPDGTKLIIYDHLRNPCGLALRDVQSGKVQFLNSAGENHATNYLYESRKLFSPKGSFLIAGSFVWDMQTGKENQNFSKKIPDTGKSLFSDDETMFACGYDFSHQGNVYNIQNKIKIINTSNGDVIQTINTPKLFYFTFVNDNKNVLVQCNGGTYIYDIKTGSLLHELHIEHDEFSPAFYYTPFISVFSPDKRICVMQDKRNKCLKIVDAKNWNIIKSIQLKGLAKSVLFSESGDVLFVHIPCHHWYYNERWKNLEMFDTKTWQAKVLDNDPLDNYAGGDMLGIVDDALLMRQGDERIDVLSIKTFELIQKIDLGSCLGLHNRRLFTRTVDNKNIAVNENKTVKVYKLDSTVVQWLKNNLLPEQARIITRAYESQQKDKRLVLTSQGAIDIFNTFPAHVKKYLIERFGILTEFRRRSERLRSKRKREDGSSGNAKRKKLNSGDKK